MRKFFLAILLSRAPLLAQAQRNYLQDNSDWWSLIRREAVPTEIPTIQRSNKPIDEANFRIAGISIAENQFAELTKKFGKADEIERGDAASGRHQVCYRSVDGARPVHLIFEFGEVEGIFYLFEGGPDWKGSEACVRSKLVSRNLSTQSGLRLGLSRPEVEVILGKPDAATGESIFYSREVKRKATKKEFAEMRRDYPAKLSDEDAHEKFDIIEFGVEIEIHFENSRLVYLAASKDVA